MKHINIPFSEKLIFNNKDKRLFYGIPDEMESIILTIIDDGGKIYINDEATKHTRVCKQALIKIHQDYKVIKMVLREGYQTQAATIASSMLETVYFISYIGYKPEKVDEWLAHDEHKWSDNFNNWLTATLAQLVKKGEITNDFRKDWEDSERNTYSILCAAKHNNGFSIRKTNVVMEEEGRPYLVSEPRYTAFSRSDCSHIMATATRIAGQGVGAYLKAVYPDRTYRASLVAKGLGEEALKLGLEISEDISSILSQEKSGVTTPKTNDVFQKTKVK